MTQDEYIDKEAPESDELDFPEAVEADDAEQVLPVADLSRPLDIDEIDFRIQSINKGGHATILAYKDARIDMKRLNEVYGVGNWQRKHEEIGGRLYCSIGLWHEKSHSWAWVQDVGTESYTEKEKGQASDSFKRASFNLGIGVELYDYPLIQIKLNDDEWEMKNNKPSQTWNLKLREWYWKSAFDVDDKLTYLAAFDHNGNQRFKWHKDPERKHRFKKGEKEAIYTAMMLYLENGDETGIKEIFDEYQENDERMKVWALFNSTERATIKGLMTDE